MSDLHALLIGIDCYLPNRFPNGDSFPSLSGSVRDIEQVEAFLRNDLDRPPCRVLKLTASRGPGDEPTEERGRWPTYENMVTAFRELTRGAEPGDQVYIHYAGHGGRAAPMFPEIKAFDEGLVPCDIGGSEARYLRGAEIAVLLREMVEKRLGVTVVFDCCHAGGAARGRKRGTKGPVLKAVPRGLSVVDRRPRPMESLVARREDLLKILQRPPAPGPVKRNLVAQDNWLPDPQGTVFLAACRPQESAWEVTFDDGHSQGALTYWLLDTLRQSGTDTPALQVKERVFAKIQSDPMINSQTPMLMGEVAWPFLPAGENSLETPLTRDSAKIAETLGPSAVTVLSFDEGRVYLQAGQAQGMRPGARFAIFRPGADVEREASLATVEIRESGAASSWGEIVDGKPKGPIEEGGRAVFLGGALRCTVRLVGDTGSWAGLLRQVQDVVIAEAKRPGGFLRHAEEGDEADFLVTVADGGELEIQNSEGRPLPYLGPPLKAVERGSPLELTRRLVHLARYRNVEQLANYYEESPLRGKLAVKILGTQMDFQPGERPRPKAIGSLPVVLRNREWLFLEIENRSSRILNVVVLDLQPDWGISQVFPGPRGGEFLPLDPDATKLISIHGFLPDGYEEGTDIIKIFATVGPPNFRSLLLPALNQRGATRHVLSSAFASEEWTTEQVVVQIRK
jgi:hypothetical protein